MTIPNIATFDHGTFAGILTLHAAQSFNLIAFGPCICGSMPPPEPSARLVEAKVIEIEQKKFTVVQPSVPDKPGKSAPYPTSDIRRAMNRPSCTAVQQPGSEEEEVIFVWILLEQTEEH